MNKKALLITSIATVFAVGIGAVAMSGINQVHKMKADPVYEPLIRKLDLSENNCTVSFSDAEYVSSLYSYVYGLTITSKTVTGSNLETEEYFFDEEENWFVGTCVSFTTELTFDTSIGDEMLFNVTIPSGSYGNIIANIVYCLFDGALFDESSSYFVYKHYDKDKEKTNYKTVYFSEDEGWDYYYATNSYDTYAGAGDQFGVQRIHLEYLC